MTPRLYVDDILTTQRCLVFHTEDYKEVRRHLLKPFSGALYVDVANFKHQPLTYQPKAKKNKYERVTSTKYNQSLIEALDRYKHTTSDGNEEFLRTARNDPMKG